MILVKDTDAKSVNAAILALNDDLDKQVKAVKNNNAGIVEGETYNINISGNANTASKVNSALTITNNSISTVYDGSSAKSIVISSSSFSDAGDATHPIYFASNKPTVCFDTIANSITGNAATASKVNNALTLNVGGNATSYDGSEAKTVTIGSNEKLTVATTNTYTAASTTEYDGSTAKTATIYTPDQAVNKTSSPTFNTVTAALNGNATSADKVNNVLTLNVNGTTTSYDGSEAKTATIYTPDQEVNKASSPTFASIIAASLIGNASTATKLIGSPTKKYGFTYSEYNYSNIPSLDMNYYQSPGIYSFVEDMNHDTSKSLVNAPFSKVGGGWSLMVLPIGSRYYCQLFFSYDGPEIYVRCSYYTGAAVGFGPWNEK